PVRDLDEPAADDERRGCRVQRHRAFHQDRHLQRIHGTDAMKTFSRTLSAIAFALLTSLTAAQAQIVQPIGPATTVGVVPVGDTTITLQNLIGKTSATACIVGDSTATPGPALSNGIDPSQLVWGYLT